MNSASGISGFVGGIARGISSTFFAVFAPSRIDVGNVFDKYAIPRSDETLEPEQGATDQFWSAIHEHRQVWVTGRSGAGKTTFALAMVQFFGRHVDRRNTQLKSTIISGTRLEGFHDFRSALVDCVSNSATRDAGWLRSFAARRLISSEPFLVVIDDVDCISDSVRTDVAKFIRTNPNHRIVFVSSSRPSEHEKENCSEIEIQDWDQARAKQYIQQRVKSRPRRKPLISNLHNLNIFKERLSAFEWKSLVDTYLADRIYEVFHPKQISGIAEYALTKSLLKIEFDNTPIGWKEGVRRTGRLALGLMKRRRMEFALNELDIDEDSKKTLMSKLFRQKGDHLCFAASSYQALLAGAYLVMFWDEAMPELQDDSSTELVWSSLFNCACVFAEGNDIQKGNLQACFTELARRMPAAFQRRSPRIRATATNLPSLNESAILMSKLRSYFDSVGVDFDSACTALGKLALNMALGGRSIFSDSDAEMLLGKKDWRLVRSKMEKPMSGSLEQDLPLVKQGLLFRAGPLIQFSHRKWQDFLCGKFLGEHWASHKRHISESDLSRKTLREMCLKARAFIVPELLDEVESWIEAPPAPNVVIHEQDRVNGTELLELEFDTLSSNEALGRITASQKARLEELTTLRSAHLFAKVSEEAVSERLTEERHKKAIKNLIDLKNKKLDSQWATSHDVEFDSLASSEALGRILAEEKVRLDKLTKIRDLAVFPKSQESLAAEKQIEDRQNNVLSALRLLRNTIRAEDNSKTKAGGSDNS
jgi:hypothetical protein